MDSGLSTYSHDELVEAAEELGALADAVAAGAVDGGPTVQRLLIGLAESVDASMVVEAQR